MKNPKIEEILKNIPLEAKIKVSLEMAFINLISELGYREDKMWTEEEQPILNKLLDLANKSAKDIMNEIEKHKEK